MDRIEAAAERLLDLEMVRMPCQYPTEHTWRDLWGWRDVPFVDELTAAMGRYRTVAVRGPIGAGKTFHALLAGFHWKAQARSRLAHYALSPLEVRLDELQEQWRDLGERECLWILDDAHREEAKAKEIARMFDDLPRGRKHRLVVASWAEVIDAWTIALPIKADVIRSALMLERETMAEDLQVPPPERLVELERSEFGLREILWAAHEGLLDQNLPVLEMEWAKRLVGQISPTQRMLLHLLARLAFLEVPFYCVSSAETVELRNLRAKELVIQRPEGSRQWWVSRDTMARRLLRLEMTESRRSGRDLDGTGASLAPWFLEPLDERLRAETLHKDMLEGILDQSLGSRTDAELAQWLAVPDGGGDGRPLLRYWVDLAGQEAGGRPLSST